ncbi:MAG: hypothetical protein PHE21_03590 [Candidatus Dojkabacteria bacterium]|nr:hypothetical protein [Candidatus Dojkabacteria bacterium]
MKKILLIIILLLTFTPFSTILAQDNEEESNLISTQENRYFELTLEKITQSAFDKSIVYELTIKPLIDSPRTQITWVAPLSFKTNPRHSEFVDLEIDQTYTYKANIKPLKSGTYDISVSVVSWQYDTNYTNSISDTVVINGSLLVEPVFSEYTTGVIIITVISLLLFAFLIWFVIKLTKKGLAKAKKWLTPPT